MNRFLLSRQGVQTLEDEVDVTRVSLEIEGGGKRVAAQPFGDPLVRCDELAEVPRFLPGLHCVPLDEPVRVVSAEPAGDQGKQDALAEEQPMTRLEVVA